MTREEMIREWNALLPHAQKQVADFVAFLREQYSGTERKEQSTSLELRDEPYVAMWSDRTDLDTSD